MIYIKYLSFAAIIACSFLGTVHGYEVPNCEAIPSQQVVTASDFASLPELSGAAKGDPSSIKEQSFARVGSTFKSSDLLAVDLSATFTTNKIVEGNRITNVQTTAHFEIRQNGAEMFSPIGNQYDALVFKVEDINGKIYRYNFKDVTACKVVLDSRTAWGVQIKNVSLLGAK